MKTSLVLLVFIFVTSCSFGTKESNNQKTSDSDDVYSIELTSSSEDASYTAELQTHEPMQQQKFEYIFERDAKTGEAISRSPYPKGWTQVSDPNAKYAIEGPNGIKVNKVQFIAYVYTLDQTMAYYMQASGQNVLVPMSFDTYIDQILRPYAETQGLSFVKAYPLPEIGAFWTMYESLLGPLFYPAYFDGYAVEWIRNNGKKHFTPMAMSMMPSAEMLSWSMIIYEIEAEPASFEQAKKDYVYALLNPEYSPKWLQNARVDRARFLQEMIMKDQMDRDATARANQVISQNYSDILDIMHKGYQTRSAMGDIGHARTVDMILERNVVSNPNTADRYYVPSGNTYYWVNDGGEYLGSDNALFDPRLNIESNGSWVKMKVEQ